MCTPYYACFIRNNITNWLLFQKLKSQKPLVPTNLQWFFIYMPLFPKEVKSDKSFDKYSVKVQNSSKICES